MIMDEKNFSAEWLMQELLLTNFQDKRLKERFCNLMLAFIADPLATIGKALTNVSDIKGAYRFFGNEKVSSDKILYSHNIATANRINEDKVALLVQDTTSLNYTNHETTEGLGHIGSAKVRKDASGLFVHTTFALNTSGTPLGILQQQIWARKFVERDEKNEKKIRLRKTKIEDKESFRWIKSIDICKKLISDQSEVIHVCDREADIFEFMSTALSLNSSFIVRAKSDRLASDDKDNFSDLFLLSEAFLGKLPIAEMKVKIQGNGERSEREANVEIYSRRLNIQCPERNQSLQTNYHVNESLEVSFLHVVEKDVKQKDKKISWVLLTNLPIKSAQEAIKIVTWYTYRWRIEEFHKILKSGCNIEQVRLGSAEKLSKMIACKSIIAHRICQLSYLCKEVPQQSCENILNDKEWKCLYATLFENKRKIPKKPPTIYEAVLGIARLGGYMGRKNQKPGIVTIWRGWTRLAGIVNAFDSFTNAGFMTYG